MVKKNRVCLCIPARYQSERLPGKPLVDIHGKAMLHRVIDHCRESRRADRLVVLTDDERIFEAVQSWGYEVEMTAAHHQSGTERILEFARRSNYDYYVNIQGDEPLVEGTQIDYIIDQLVEGTSEIVTPVIPARTNEELFDFARVKVVMNQAAMALYFSRNAVPAHRDLPYDQWLKNAAYFIHTGIYGFTKKALNDIGTFSPTPLEQSEKLEQLRWLECGMQIRCILMEDWRLFSVDTEEDLRRMRSMLKIKR